MRDVISQQQMLSINLTYKLIQNMIKLKLICQCSLIFLESSKVERLKRYVHVIVEFRTRMSRKQLNPNNLSHLFLRKLISSRKWDWSNYHKVIISKRISSNIHWSMKILLMLIYSRHNFHNFGKGMSSFFNRSQILIYPHLEIGNNMKNIAQDSKISMHSN